MTGIRLNGVLCVQVPSLCEDLLSSVDQPLKIARDKVVGKDYLLCDYNRDGDSYRSGGDVWTDVHAARLHTWINKRNCYIFI